MPEQRPDIVFIIAEHWRGDCLSSQGNSVAETPHLDELSARGVTFTNAFTPCPSCIAARRSIMTGMVPNSHGMLGYQDGRPWHYRHTLAGELARAGYQTINVGKTHFHPQRLHLGFEELITPQDYDEWINEQTGLSRAKFAHGVHGNSWMARANHLPEHRMEETWLTDQAIKRLEKRDPERPFMLCLSYNGIHPPWCPPQTYFDLFMQKQIPMPVVGDWAAEAELPDPPDVNAWHARLSPELNHRARAAYYAYAAYVDAQIGRFVEYLGRSGQRRNTLFLFTADHGEMLGDHHLWRKTYAYEPSARIPFIVKAPDAWKVPRNVRSDELVGLEDVMPTFLEAAGVTVPDTVEGLSVTPVLHGKAMAGREVYHHEHSPCYSRECAYQCITQKEWKYIWNPITGEEQLFDRKNDPEERVDLASDPAHAQTLAGLRATLAAHLKGRPENLSDGETLTPNPVPVWRG